jgi:hypothetical protein
MVRPPINKKRKKKRILKIKSQRGKALRIVERKAMERRDLTHKIMMMRMQPILKMQTRQRLMKMRKRWKIKNLNKGRKVYIKRIYKQMII